MERADCARQALIIPYQAAVSRAAFCFIHRRLSDTTERGVLKLHRLAGKTVTKELSDLSPVGGSYLGGYGAC